MISVCVPTFNGAAYVEAQLASILASPLVTEVLVSDDGSSDDTVAIVESLGDPRVRQLSGPGHGLIRNYEFLLSQVAGDYIFLADQDDVWLPNKVEVMLARLCEVDLAVCDCAVVDAQLKVLHPSFFALRRSGPGFGRNLLRNSYLGCCLAFRRQLLAKALPLPADVPMHDWWLGLVAECFGSVDFIDQPLMLYRRHGGNASSAAEPSRARTGTRLYWRLRLIRALLGRRLGL